MTDCGMQGVSLYQGDALRVLETLETGSVDALITDPPYSSGGMMRGDRMATTNDKYVNSETFIRRDDFTGDNRDQRGFEYWCLWWMGECWRVVKDGGVVAIFSDWRQLPTVTDLIQAAGFVWRGIVVWDKTEAARPQPGRFRNQAEFVVWGSRGPSPLVGDPLPGVIRCVVRQADKYHVTGKPLTVMQALVKVCPVGGVVLDPFMGSGTTGVAAVMEGRRFVGVELSAGYYEVAKGRINAALAQGARFIYAVADVEAEAGDVAGGGVSA